MVGLVVSLCHVKAWECVCKCVCVCVCVRERERERDREKSGISDCVRNPGSWRVKDMNLAVSGLVYF